LAENSGESSAPFSTTVRMSSTERSRLAPKVSASAKALIASPSRRLTNSFMFVPGPTSPQ